MKRWFGLFPITWKVARDYIIESQICYCEDEMMFYNQSEENAKNKLVIYFDTYVKNLSATLQHVYSFLNIPMSSEILSKAAALQISSHDRTKRKMPYDPKYSRPVLSIAILCLRKHQIQSHSMYGKKILILRYILQALNSLEGSCLAI